jgi:stage V sporulation protein B
LFAGETNAINISAPLLSVLGIAVFFSSVMTVTNSILQAYGMERKPIISMFAGALVKTLFSYILIGVPKINIFGAPISTLLCAITVTLINLYYIKKATGELESTSRLFIKPMLAATVSIGAAGMAYYTVASIFGKSYALTLGAIALAVLLYGVCALKMKAVVSEDINLLPMGDKIEKLLRKVKLL